AGGSSCRPASARRDLSALTQERSRADHCGVLVERFPVAVGLLAGLLIAVVGIFVLSMPAYRSPIDRTMLSTSAERHFTAPQIRRAFRVRGLTLPASSTALNGVTLAAADPTLYVFVAKE